MKKMLLLFILSFFVFGIALSFPIVLADEDDDNSGSGDGDRFREEVKIEFINEEGKRVEIERKIEIEGGEIKIVIKRKIISSDGTVVEKIVIVERSEDGTKTKIKIKIENGTDEFEVETELEIDDEFEGNETNLGAITSDGKKHRIIVLPDRASEIAIEILKSKNFTVELKEILHKNVPRVVYHIESNKTGRFLGIFKLKMKVEGQIDSETGEFLGIIKPWWAFLVVGEDSDQTGEGDNGENEEEGNETQKEESNETGNEGNETNTNVSVT